MAVTLFQPPRMQVESATGAPMSGARLYFYATGTTTPVATYQDADRTVPHAHPVVADASGTFPAIYLPDGQSKAVLKTAADVTVWTVDPVGELSPPPTVTAIPTGTFLPFGGTSAPSGFLLCDGTAYSRTTYAALFAVIGTAFGSGDGATTFNVPDLRGRAPWGLDNMGGVDAGRISSSVTGRNTRGASGGASTATLAEANLPAHSHTGTTSSNGDHSHTVPIQTNAEGGAGGAGRMVTGGTTSTSTAGAHTHTFTTSTVGSGAPFVIMPPVIFCNWIIKT